MVSYTYMQEDHVYKASLGLHSNTNTSLPPTSPLSQKHNETKTPNPKLNKNRTKPKEENKNNWLGWVLFAPKSSGAYPEGEVPCWVRTHS